jgi:hypothetical protein
LNGLKKIDQVIINNKNKMGKAAKEHRAKVAKRNAKIKQQKSGMQKAFDLASSTTIEKLKKKFASMIGDKQEVNFELLKIRLSNTHSNLHQS